MGLVGSLAAASGALIGGVLVEATSWRLLFLVNVPVARGGDRVGPATSCRRTGRRRARAPPGSARPCARAGSRVAASVADAPRRIMLAVFGLLPLYLEGVLGMATIAAGVGRAGGPVDGGRTARPPARLIVQVGPAPRHGGAMAAMAAAAAPLARVPADGPSPPTCCPGLLLFGAAIPVAFATVNALTLDAAPPGAEGAATGVIEHRPVARAARSAPPRPSALAGRPTRRPPRWPPACATASRCAPRPASRRARSRRRRCGRQSGAGAIAAKSGRGPSSPAELARRSKVRPEPGTRSRDVIGDEGLAGGATARHGVGDAHGVALGAPGAADRPGVDAHPASQPPRQRDGLADRAHGSLVDLDQRGPAVGRATTVATASSGAGAR